MRTELERRELVQNDRISRYERMVEIRAFEDRLQELFSEGLIPGTTHLCQGQEAVAVGLAASIATSDTVTCTYRGHGVALALGLTPESLLGEIMGRETGSIGGVGGSMHLSEPSVGLLPSFAIVGAGIPVAVGTALRHQVLETEDISVAVFGDGASNIGAFHEGLNLAAIWNLPTVFICENNQYGEYSRIDTTTPITDIAKRADSYGMPGLVIDGQDLDEVVNAVTEAATAARTGSGPCLLEMKTYRYAGHSRADTAPYRPEGEFEDWYTRDPINNFRDRLMGEGLLSEESDAELLSSVTERIESAVTTAINSPAPGVKAMFSNITASR
jgi:TPP-dependent pyruvate/acetoin dehydrogenase alpha subunit